MASERADVIDIGDENEEIFIAVYAPVITLFAEHTLLSAKERGIERLYFLARDGWLIYLAARELEKKLNTGVELKYLNVSRYALRLAEYSLPETDVESLICMGGMTVTFESLMRRGALSDEETADISDRTGYKGREKEILSYKKIRELCATLRNVPQFSKYVKTHSQKSIGNTLDYLKQEGLCDDLKYAVVDSGWIGTVQRSIGRLTAAANNPKDFEGYYFGMYDLPIGVDLDRYNAYYIRPGCNIKRRSSFCICLFEAVCSSADGMTLGYEKDESGHTYAVKGPNNPNFEIINKNEKVFLRYLSEIEISDEFDLGKALRLSENILSKHMGNPCLREAELYGGLQFSDDVFEKEMQDVAVLWNRTDIHNNNVINKVLTKCSLGSSLPRPSGWPEGSIVRCMKEKSGLSLWHERTYKKLAYMGKATFYHG